jgi:metaxin
MHDVVDMIVNAKKCLNWLSEKLGENNKFFLGVPSELDATIYAYLAVILHHTLPKNELQNHVKNCPNLVNYVENFTKHFSPEECFSSKDDASKSKPKNGQTFHTGQEDEENLGTKRRRQILSGLFALISMSSYAFFSGIVQVRAI